MHVRSYLRSPQLLTGAAGLSHALCTLVGFVGCIQGSISSSLGSARLTAGSLGGSSGVGTGIASTGYLAFKGGYTILEGIKRFLGYASGKQKYCREGEEYVFHLWSLMVSNRTREPYQ